MTPWTALKVPWVAPDPYIELQLLRPPLPTDEDAINREKRRAIAFVCIADRCWSYRVITIIITW